MDIPTVDSCCFGLLPLKTGALVAGIVCFRWRNCTRGLEAWCALFNDDEEKLHLVVAEINFKYEKTSAAYVTRENVFTKINADEALDVKSDHFRRFEVFRARNMVIEALVHGGSTYYTSSEDWLRTVYGLLVLFGIISSLLLIAGVLMDNKLLVKCFLIAFILLIIFTIVLFVLVLVDNRIRGNSNYIVSNVVYLCIIGYCLIVANSYYKTMAG